VWAATLLVPHVQVVYPHSASHATVHQGSTLTVVQENVYHVTPVVQHATQVRSAAVSRAPEDSCSVLRATAVMPTVSHAQDNSPHSV
jgi:hypothetical protein